MIKEIKFFIKKN